MKSSFLLTLLIIFSGYLLSAQEASFYLKQSNSIGIYKKGEKINVYAFTPKASGDSLRVTVFINNNHVIYKRAFFPSGDSILIYECIAGKPSSYIVEARLSNQKKVIGMMTNPEKLIPGTRLPKGFTAYWKQEKEQLHALPLQVKLKEVENTEKGYVCYDTELNCTGPKPARGYFAKPQNASPKSLPIVLLVHAAGVKGSWCRSNDKEAVRYAKSGKGALCFDLNAHGMLNGQPEEYYANLESGELKDYYAQGIEGRDEFYFRGMYLRLIRTLDYLTQQPEWDGKRIIVIGESQGGDRHWLLPVSIQG